MTCTSNPYLAGKATPTGYYKIGDKITCNAIPANGYEFTSWTNNTGTVLSTNRLYTITLEADTYLVANFTKTVSPIPVDPSGGGGGGGSGIPDSDTFDDDDRYNPGAGVITGTGMSTVWCPTNDQLSTLSGYLYGNDLSETVKAVFDKLGSLGGQVSDYFLHAFHLPVSIDDSQRKTSAFNIGWYKTTVDSDYTTSWGMNIDLGSIEIPRYYGNALDYRMNIQLFLPYIGYVPIDPVSVVGKTLNITYYISFITGQCVAHIKVDGVEHYQFTGSMALDIPVSQDSTLANAVVNVGTTAASAGLKKATNIPLIGGD